MSRSGFNSTTGVLVNTGYLSSAVTAPVSVGIWFQAPNLNAGCLFTIGTSASTDRLSLASDGAGKIWAGHTSGGAQSETGSTTTYTANTWNYGLAVFTSNSSRTVYLNGGGSSTNTVTRANITVNGLGAGGWYRSSSSVNTPWPGIIAELAIWKTALTAADALALAQGASPLSVRSDVLVDYYPLIGTYSPEISLKSTNALSVNGSVTSSPLQPRIVKPPRQQLII